VTLPYRPATQETQHE